MADMLTRPRGSIKKVMYGEDGHVYYVIAAEGQEVRMGIQYLERFEDLNRHIGEPGLFFVRDAAAKYSIPGDESSTIIQNGDPTVHEGWAMYCWDVHKTNTTAGWRKVAEQESVDGPWGIDERILKMLVKRTEFNSYVEQNDRRVINLEGRVQTNESNINGLNASVNELKRTAHGHNNKEAVLDKLSTVGGQLLFDGVAISGNTFLYNNIVEGKIVWKDPTNPDAEVVECANAKTAADQFVACSMATPGMVLSVVEPDGSITSFDLIKPSGSESIVAINKDNAVAVGVGSVTYVTELDKSGTSYVGRGIFCPITDDGEYEPFELYEYVEDRWVSLKEKNGAGKFISVVGAAFTLCLDEASPDMPYKRVNLFWNDNLRLNQTDTNGVRYSWKETRLVRKFGSVPTTPEDGVLVFVSTRASDGTDGYIDTIPYSNEPVYYQLFTITKSGAICTPAKAEGVTPIAIEWYDVHALISDSVNQRRLREKLLPVGASVVLPPHPYYGQLVGVIIESTGTALSVIVDVCLEEGNFDKASTVVNNLFDGYSKYVPSFDGKVQEGKTYAYFDNGYKEFELEVGTEFPEGKLVYEKLTDFANGIFNVVALPDRTLIKSETLPVRRHLDRSVPYWCSNRSASDGSISVTAGCAVMLRITK